VLACACILLAALPRPSRGQACCAGAPLGPQNCNVIWVADDQVAGCPGGDSLNVFTSGHPSALRIRIHYEDNDCNFRVGVPPESIWVTYTTLAGNLQLNDKGTKVFADDSTDADGDTWITLRSFSGCGTIRCSLFVSGKFSGHKDRQVRTTDQNGNGRVDVSEGSSPCDLNYDGLANDGSFRVTHEEHWKRNALHGAMVRRTNYCETCPAFAPNTKGASQIFWSPSQRFISHTFFADDAPVDTGCVVVIVPSDPQDGNSPTQFTSPPPKYHDYDPSWSPLNDVISWDRADSVILKKATVVGESR
jgi:hypothetical protein